jgi:hypothetical protein
MNIPAELTDLAIETLSRIDAVWTPCRFSSMTTKAVAAIYEQREADGVLVVGGGSVRDRVSHHRMLASARAAGVLVVSGDARPLVKLTAEAEASARSLCGLDSLFASFPLMASIDKAAARCGTNCGFVGEDDVLGKPYDQLQSHDLVRLENKLLPLLVRGWLESDCDSEGRVGYRITEAGRAAVRPKRAKLPAFNQFCADEYDRLYSPTMDERNSLEPDRPGHLAIPLSCGCWGETETASE